MKITDELIDEAFKKFCDYEDHNYFGKDEINEDILEALLTRNLVAIKGDYLRDTPLGLEVKKYGGWVKYQKKKDVSEKIQTDEKNLVLLSINKQMEYHTEAIKDLKNSGKEKIKYFILGFLASIISALIGTTPTIIEKLQNRNQETHIEFPKMVLIHDTITVRDTVWIKKN